MNLLAPYVLRDALVRFVITLLKNSCFSLAMFIVCTHMSCFVYYAKQDFFAVRQVGARGMLDEKMQLIEEEEEEDGDDDHDNVAQALIVSIYSHEKSYQQLLSVRRLLIFHHLHLSQEA